MNGKNSGARCSHDGCVNAEVASEGVRVTSTIEGNDGLTIFTTVEWDAFVEQVKAGAWDHTVSGALVS